MSFVCRKDKSKATTNKQTNFINIGIEWAATSFSSVDKIYAFFWNKHSKRFLLFFSFLFESLTTQPITGIRNIIILNPDRGIVVCG